MEKLSDDDLKNKTTEFQKRYQSGETLNQILPEAYAAIREAAKRVLGLYPYDVQVLGGIVLHEGHTIEMKTGEGKTLTATMPLYLNGLTNEGVYLMTTNQYLASRDGREMGKLFEWMGLTVSIGFSETGEDLTDTQKSQIYQADIVYTTHSAFGFDYLFHNLAEDNSGQYIRSFKYAVVDEVDSVLLDAAQTPLVISGQPRVQSNHYRQANQFVQTLIENEDYRMDAEKQNVWLTQKGTNKAEQYFRIENLYSPEYSGLARVVFLSVRANYLMKKDYDYAVDNGIIKLIDKESGRLLEGVRLQSGIHQAIEAKENVELTADNRSIASITYQNLFRKFSKLAGMSGTANVVEEELIDTYDMNVIVIPTNKPLIREDYPDQIYRSLPEKLQASMEYIRQIHATNQPILVTTGSVVMSQLYSNLLLREGIPHNLLNAYNIAKESEMIEEAGQIGAVTVATSMAGRGTDIKLGPGVKELGGLAVIGTERMLSKRGDLQLRGRAGRQGDPGLSKFYASFEDSLILRYGVEKHQYIAEEDENIISNPRVLTSHKYTKAIDRAQKASDNAGVQQRNQSLLFDEELRIQREIVYLTRDKLINDSHNYPAIMDKVMDRFIENILKKDSLLAKQDFLNYIRNNIDYNYKEFPEDISLRKKKELQNHLVQLVKEKIAQQKELLDKHDKFDEFIRLVFLKSIDQAWILQVDYLEQYKKIITTKSNSQENPQYEFQREAARTYEEMRENIIEQVVRYACLSLVDFNDEGTLVIYYA